MSLPKLPIGIQTFGKLREGGYLYVDKTKYLIDLIDNGTVYFLSRPRRFGKSLTISTFDALFSGRQDLFKGLYAEEFFNRPEYKIHPVIHLDMSQVTVNMGIDTLCKSILRQIQLNAERLKVNTGSLASTSPGDAFADLIQRATEHASVVILIDEYDSPMLKYVHQPEKVREIREVLHDFYIQIKASDAYLRFVFMTGISKFSKMGVFSAMNNMIDISMNDRYAGMLGYTDEELLTYFDTYIANTAIGVGESKETIISGIRDYYDGFSFDGKTRLYNPFSVLNFFNDPTFKNYWFESGTPSALAEYVKRHDIEAENFRSFATDDEFTSTAEIENTSPESFLYQSGYLSVREKKGRKLILDYPNMEVLSSVSKLFMYGKYNVPNSGNISISMEEAVSRGDAEEIVKIYNSLLASLPYDIYEREERKYAIALSRTENFEPAPYAESFYHSLLFTLIWASRVNTTAENHSYWGRSDIEAEKNGRHYVIELKIAEGATAEKTAAEAMQQIKNKGYADKYASTGATLIAIAVDKGKRRVGSYLIENI